METTQRKLIIIVGPTASGKSELAVQLARKVNGEIISADSRQIYRGMDIGSGKVEGRWVKLNDPGHRGITFVYKDIPHYLIDEASPRVQYSVARFQKKVEKIIEDIFKRGKQPIICGGTAHWVDAIAYGQTLPAVKPDAKLRARLEKLPVAKLFQKLQQLDPQRASEIDPNNPRRLIRALEIVLTTGKPVPKVTTTSKYKIEWIGLKPDEKTLERKIRKRLRERLQNGLLAEVKKLRTSRLSWKRLESFGLEYKFCALYLQGKIAPENTLSELEAQLFTAIRQYAKRQMTWWKRNPDINWRKPANKSR